MAEGINEMKTCQYLLLQLQNDPCCSHVLIEPLADSNLPNAARFLSRSHLWVPHGSRLLYSFRSIGRRNKSPEEKLHDSDMWSIGKVKLMSCSTGAALFDPFALEMSTTKSPNREGVCYPIPSTTLTLDIILHPLEPLPRSLTNSTFSGAIGEVFVRHKLKGIRS